MSICILVADDEDSIRQGVAHYLMKQSEDIHQVLEAKNGVEVIDKVVQFAPDILVLDVEMPLKSGMQVLQELKTLEIEVPTLILSGYDEFRYAQEVMRLGAKCYLLKPVAASEILSCILEYAQTSPVAKGESAQPSP